jgi:membrane protein DedA with SNARE-associated domain
MFHFAHSAPGRRFQELYERRAPCSVLKRWGRLLGGGLLCLAGLVMLVAPGPGILILLIGGALVAQESIAVARLLDRAELRIRRWLKRLR